MVLVKITDSISIEIACPLHAPGIYRAVDENRKYLSEYLDWVEKTKSIVDVCDSIKRGLTSLAEGNGASYVILEKQRPIGRISIWETNAKAKIYEIGYWIEEKSTRMGIMSKCVSEVIKIGFEILKAQKIEIQCAKGNEPSNRIAKKIGMVYEGTIRKCEVIGEKKLDLNVFGLLKEEYEKNV